MISAISFSDVPYLEELLNYLPIEATDRKDVNTYLRSITESILVTYSNEQYQFAYFGLHLLYMTYIYFSVKKISQINPERYKDAVIFAKPYHNKELDFNNISSVFDYSLVPEKELPKIFEIIELNVGQINKIGNLVESRNEMAHANGWFAILNEKDFYVAASVLCDSVRNIHSRMDGQIRNWFKDFLLRFCNKEFEEYGNDDISDIIKEQMVEGFNLSAQELLVCNEMSIKSLVSEKPEYKNDLDKFKKALRGYCSGEV